MQKKRLESYSGLKSIQTTFQELVKSNLLDTDSDFLVSSLAIHHLQAEQTESLFKYIYNKLNPGGFFLNIDVVCAPLQI